MLAAMRRIATAIVVALSASAAAQPSPGDTDDEAASLFVRARELKKAGQTREACALFDQSYQLEPAAGTGLNLADCLEQQGKLSAAWALFDGIARNPQNAASRTQLARARADALLAKLAVVVVDVRAPLPAGLALRLGDRGLAPIAHTRLIIEPGDLELVASVPDRAPHRVVLHATAGATVTAEVPVFADPVARRSRTALYVAGGLGTAGVVGLGVSLGFAIAARGANQDAFDRGCAHTPDGVVCAGGGDGGLDGRRLIHLAGARADLATGFAIGGAALLGAAATVLLTSRETVQVAPVAAGPALGVGVVGRF